MLELTPVLELVPVVELRVSVKLEVGEPVLLADEPVVSPGAAPVVPDDVDTTPGPWVGSAPESPSSAVVIDLRRAGGEEETSWSCDSTRRRTLVLPGRHLVVGPYQNGGGGTPHRPRRRDAHARGRVAMLPPRQVTSLWMNESEQDERWADSLEHLGTMGLQLVETDLALIVPGGAGCGYSTDEAGRLTGLKLGLMWGPRLSPAFFEWLFRQESLERLVLASKQPDFPEGVGALPALRYLALNGFGDLPQDILGVEGPILAWGDYDADVSRLFHSQPALAKLLRGLDPGSRRMRVSSHTVVRDDIAADSEHEESLEGDSDGASSAQSDAIEIDENAKSLEDEENAMAALKVRGVDRRAILEQFVGLSLGGTRSPPPEIVGRGRDALVVFFEASLGGSQPLKEAKLILVGHGASGKTSIVNGLCGRSFDPAEPQTHGININPVTVGEEGIVLNAWDFGGQEIMHATHQFFLSKRSAYLVVLDSRKDDQAEYWLKHVESFGGDSPVVVVLNKTDENPGFDLNRRFLKEKYRGIVGFVRTSCSDGTGFDELRSLLQDALDKVEILRTPWPSSWFRVRQELENDSSHFLSADRYQEVCRRLSVLGADSQGALAQFLNDLGVLVHFADFSLRHVHVLEPRWLTYAVYAILNAPALSKSGGVLGVSMLREILGDDDYPPETYHYIVGVMRKFELCYQISDRAEFLVPDLLSVSQPELPETDREQSVVVFEYADFVPRSILPRLMVRMHPQIVGELRWRTGVMFEDDESGARALVRVDYQERKVRVVVSGTGRRDYLAVIRSELRQLHRRFERLDVAERVPLPDNPRVSVSYKHLILLEERGDTKLLPEGSEREYDVSELLGTVRVAAERTQDEFVQILRTVLASGDDKVAAVEKVNDILMLQPNFMGLGLNINALIDRVWGERKPKNDDLLALPDAES